jgi:hypothetical protein
VDPGRNHREQTSSSSSHRLTCQGFLNVGDRPRRLDQLRSTREQCKSRLRGVQRLLNAGHNPRNVRRNERVLHKAMSEINDNENDVYTLVFKVAAVR